MLLTNELKKGEYFRLKDIDGDSFEDFKLSSAYSKENVL